ncbi:MAG: hypothetical protein ACK501_04915 [Planctomycetota bacterium]
MCLAARAPQRASRRRTATGEPEAAGADSDTHREPERTFVTPNAAGTADRVLVSFPAGGTDYGPYEVPGTLSVLLDDVDWNLGPIPALDNNPLAGSSLAMALQEILTGPEYFAELDDLGLSSESGGRQHSQAGAMTGRHR